jgi:two-component system NtrC family response regulator
MLSLVLRKAGYQIKAVDNGEEALKELMLGGWDMVLSDIRMPQMDGHRLLQEIQDRGLETTVIMMSAYGDRETALEAIQKGAYDYISKPFKKDDVLLTLRKAEERESLRRENRILRQQTSERPSGLDSIIARSQAMEVVFRTVRKVAQYKTTVLLSGESGTGKELIARAIHGRSRRGARPFVAVNCAAIPEELLESTLFGHERGAFTGASRAAPGKFRQADGGTLFLDEIAELSPHLQSKLLRVLQEGEVEVVGAARPVRVDTRVIAATHQDLEALMQTGALRQDLYYRLNVVPIEIPPLRQRPEDIPALTRFFLRKLSPDVRVTVSREVDRRLLAYHWPGNVRELQNVIERMVLLRDGDTLGAEALPGFIQAPASAETTRRLPFALPEEGLDLMALERAIIEAALEKMGGNRSATARYLQIPRHVLLYRLEKYGIS